MSFEVPDACTLATAERPVRLAEVDELLATAVRRVERATAERVRMWLTGPAGLEQTVRDLTARETKCCPFFSFTIMPEPGGEGEALWLEVAVPAEHTEVLEALAQRAAARAA